MGARGCSLPGYEGDSRWRAARQAAAELLEALAAAVPYRVHTVLADNGTQFIDNALVAAYQPEGEAEDEAVRGDALSGVA